MAYQEYVAKAITTGRSYDELPAKVRAAVQPAEWKLRVRDLCIQQGRAWDHSAARGVTQQLDYYEEMMRTYKAWGRLYPYHLSEYVARVLRVTPFRYYTDLLFLCLKEERPYDRVPNFTAADALRLTGVGRNEYIAMLNACKSKKLLWRVNKGLARDLLPQVPRDVRMEPWWRVAVVNVGESEFRELPGPEAALLRAAAEPARALPVAAFEPQLLQALYKKSLIYLEVPIGPDDRFHIPPLEGFVSNKTSDAGDASVDPFEPLMYRLFLANSSRLDQARLADILGVDLESLLGATALAVRLGFATRVSGGASPSPAAAGVASLGDGGASSLGAAVAGSGTASLGLLDGGGSSSSVLAAAPAAAPSDGDAAVLMDAQLEEAAGTAAAAAAAAAGEQPGAATAWGATAAAGDGGQRGAVAVVVDAATTSYLMMGALSAGLKRHSVSLFEGGRISGEAVVAELIQELQASAAAGAMFEGEDMAQLMRVIESLGILLQCVQGAAAAQGCQLELLRQESFEGLDPLSAAKLLSSTYAAILPISPLPGRTLPRLLCQQQQQQQHGLVASSSSSRRSLSSGLGQAAGASSLGAPAPPRVIQAAPPFPAFFGPPSPAADSPWLQLALYAAAAAGPVSLVFVAGSRVWRLPPQLQGCTHALLWGWGPAAAAASSAAAGGGGSGGKSAAEARLLLVEGCSLLCTLNELLSRTAVMVQPLVTLEQLPPDSAVAAGEQQQQQLVRFVDVPLPLCPLAGDAAGSQLLAAASRSAAAAPARGGSIDAASPAAGAAAAAAASPTTRTSTASSSSGWDPFAAFGSTPQPAAAAAQPPTPASSTARSAPAPLLVRAVERMAAAAGEVRSLELPGQLVAALRCLQLSPAVGWVRLVKLPASSSKLGAASQQQPWVPLSVNLGAPLFCPTLCAMVCGNMAQQQCLTPAGQAAWTAAQHTLQQQLIHHVDGAGAGASQGGEAGAVGGGGCWGGQGLSGLELPPQGLLFDGHSLLPVDLSGCTQGVALW